MRTYQGLLSLATLLLEEDDIARLADTILQKLTQLANANRGYLVVREAGEYSVKCNVQFDRDSVSAEDRRVSRRLVRRVIESKSTFFSNDIGSDLQLHTLESLHRAGTQAVVVAPLSAQGEVYGVIYLDRTTVNSGFSTDAVEFITDVSRMAGQVLRRSLAADEIRRRMASFERELLAQHNFQGIVTRDEAMFASLRTLAQVARAEIPVLIAGETGTGKELFARAIHTNSQRSHQAFVVINCGALPPSLLESELFGHVRGAFTGADRERPGRIRAAHGGTLFLDEVGEIPLELQARLLRFLQFGELQRVGSDKVEKVDVRVVAATHRPLRSMVEAGTFRQDLYYRLNVVQIDIPPLRNRPGDIPLMVDTFLKEIAKKSGESHRFTPAAMTLLQNHDYPGNVRELLHAVERATLLSNGADLGPELLPREMIPVPDLPAEDDSAGVSPTLARVRTNAQHNAERDFLAALMDKNQGNISAAARASGIHRSYLQRLLTKHNLRGAT
ncbi:MAG: sigma 54-interacting transcriptional regulator [Polyangiaceae bacterium]|nr:sigma 54-interacting transcriptional regulator [Polyangiaceae bacterium]